MSKKLSEEPPTKHIAKAISNIFNNPKFSDITLVVQDQRFYAHKAFLAGHSKVFEIMFFGPMIESQEKEIIIDDIEPSFFLELLTYLYLGNFKVTLENLDDVLYTAKKFEIEAFVEMAENFIIGQHLTMENVCTWFECANTFNLKNLHTKCFNLLLRSANKVLATEDANNLTKKSLLQLLQRDDISAMESSLFNACYNWCKKKGKDDEFRIRELMQEFLPLIRLSAMTVEELTLKIYPTKLIPDNVIMQTIVDLVKNKMKRSRRVGAVDLMCTDSGLLASLGGKSAYNKEFKVSLSSSGGSSGYACIADPSNTSNSIESSFSLTGDQWLCIELINTRVRLTGYMIHEENDKLLRNWKLQGSNDETTWEDLDEHRDDATITPQNLKATFPITGITDFYKYIRLLVINNHFSIYQMELFGDVQKEKLE